MNEGVMNFLLRVLPQARQTARGLKSLCPFHADTAPSFFVFLADTRDFQGWFFKCHGCNKSGTLNWLLQILGSHLRVLENLTLARPVDPQEEKTWKPDTSQGWPLNFDYFRSRGVSEEVCKQVGFRLDFATPAAVIPIYINREYKGYIKRYLGTASTMPKYLIERDVDLSNVIFGWDWIDPQKPTIVTEGPVDACCWMSEGIQAVALLGKNWKRKINLLSKLKQIIGVPDNGDRHSFNIFRDLVFKFCGRFVFIPVPYKDSSDFVMAGGQLKSLLHGVTG